MNYSDVLSQSLGAFENAVKLHPVAFTRQFFSELSRHHRCRHAGAIWFDTADIAGQAILYRIQPGQSCRPTRAAPDHRAQRRFSVYLNRREHCVNAQPRPLHFDIWARTHLYGRTDNRLEIKYRSAPFFDNSGYLYAYICRDKQSGQNPTGKDRYLHHALQTFLLALEQSIKEQFITPGETSALSGKALFTSAGDLILADSAFRRLVVDDYCRGDYSALHTLVARTRCPGAQANIPESARVRIGLDSLGVAVLLTATGTDMLAKKLSTAEYDVVRHRATGHSVKEIARLRGTSAKTVGNQIASACGKLGIQASEIPAAYFSHRRPAL